MKQPLNLRLRASSKTETRPSGCTAIVIVIVFGLGSVSPVLALPAKGKISKNVYRIPYGNGEDTKMLQDYIDHGNTPAGNTGPMDMRDQDGSPPFLVAAADGVVSALDDSFNDCGCSGLFCANFIEITHANGEISQYVHIAQNSATNAGMFCGKIVSAGEVIGVEGDVGFTCGSESAPRTGTCVMSIPQVCNQTGNACTTDADCDDGTCGDAGNCFRHLHWQVFRESPGEFVNPFTCGIPGNIYVDDTIYTAAACDSSTCVDVQNVPPGIFSGLGTFKVIQANDLITVDTFLFPFTVQDSASVVFHSGGKIKLLPGFAVQPSGHFRAEIGPCNTTASSPQPIQVECP